MTKIMLPLKSMFLKCCSKMFYLSFLCVIISGIAKLCWCGFAIRVIGITRIANPR